MLKEKVQSVGEHLKVSVDADVLISTMPLSTLASYDPIVVEKTIFPILYYSHSVTKPKLNWLNAPLVGFLVSCCLFQMRAFSSTAIEFIISSGR